VMRIFHFSEELDIAVEEVPEYTEDFTPSSLRVSFPVFSPRKGALNFDADDTGKSKINYKVSRENDTESPDLAKSSNVEDLLSTNESLESTESTDAGKDESPEKAASSSDSASKEEAASSSDSASTEEASSTEDTASTGATTTSPGP
jgi:hypothetical protein